MTSSDPSENSQEGVIQPSPRRWWALTGFGIAVLVVALDNAILALAIPSLAETLNPTASELLWIGDIYSFVLAGLLITMGSIGDRVGRKRLLIIGSIAFAILSVVAAFSPTALALIASRAAMGVAGATLMPSTLSLIRNHFPDAKERTFAVGIWAGMAAAGAGLGPIVGGVLLEHYWWGSVFIINVPIVAVMLAIGLFSWKESKDPNSRPLDFVSAGLSLVGILTVVWGIKELAFIGLGYYYGWGSLFIGIATIMIFIRRQQRLEHPMIDLALFKIPSFSGAVFSQLISVFALIGAYFFMAQQFQLVYGDGPLMAGIKLLPGEIAALIAGPTASRIIGRWGRRFTISGGIFLGGIGMLGIAITRADGLILTSISLACVGFGLGCALTGAADSILGSAPPEQAGVASAVGETAYELGAALGIALLGTILGAWYHITVVIPKGLTPEQSLAAGESLPEATKVAHEVSPEIADALLPSAQAAFSSGFGITAATAGFLCFIGAFIAFKTLPNREAEANQVIQH